MGLRRAAKADLDAAGGRELLIVSVLVLWLVYQWGFGNDALLPPIVANVADGIDDAETAPAAVGAVVGGALAGGVFWAASMAIDGIVMVAGLRHLPHLVAEIGLRLRARGWIRNWDEMRWSTRWMLAYGAGPSALILADALAGAERSRERHRRIVAASVALSAGSVAVVSAVIVSAAVVARRIPATAEAAEVLVRVARNPLFWIGLFAALWAIGWFRSRNDAPARNETDGTAPDGAGLSDV